MSCLAASQGEACGTVECCLTSPSSIIPSADPIRWQLKGPRNLSRETSTASPAGWKGAGSGLADKVIRRLFFWVLLIIAMCLGGPQVTPPHCAFRAVGTLPLRCLTSGGREKPSESFRGQATSTAWHPLPYFSQLSTAKSAQRFLNNQET